MLGSCPLRIVTLAAALVLLLTACPEQEDVPLGEPDEAEPEEEEPAEEPEEDAAVDDEPLLIGVSLASPTIPLYVAMAEGIRDAAEELGLEVAFTEAEEDVAQQLDDIDDLIAQGVDGILVSPIDFEAAKPAYEAARAADIAIMSIARNTDPELEDSFIGAPWERFGREIAEWTCESAGGEGKIAMLKGPAGASFVEEMEVGYKEVVPAECPDMEIVFETNLVPLSPDQGLAGAQDALAANPDLRAIYGNNDELAQGAIQAMEELGVDHADVLVTGFDGNPLGLELVREGKLDMTIALRPYHWGILGLETMVAYLQGEDVPQLVEIDTITVTPENIDDYDVEELR